MSTPRKLTNFNFSTNSSNPFSLVNVGGTLFFRAEDGYSGNELWKTDGTSAGTILVKNLAPGTSSPSIQGMASVGNTLFFNYFDSSVGWELWKSNGTDIGTVLVKDINVGGSGSDPSSLVNVNGTLFFAASRNNPSNGRELWKSDGTEAGTVLVRDLLPGGDSSPENLINVNGTLYFTAYTPTVGRELWKSDGTSVGTVLVKDIVAGAGYSNPQNLTNVNGTLYFTVDNNFELWKTDGTDAGTVIVRDFVNSQVSNLISVNGFLYFTVNGQLWRSDGTFSGNQIIYSGTIANLTNFNDSLYFTTGSELRKVSGGSTVVVQSFSSISSLLATNSTLYLSATTPSNGTELWKSDGTTAGTVIVKDINPDVGVSSSPANLTNVNGTIYFTANDGINGVELWKSDGTAAGTQLVRDVNRQNSQHSPANLTPMNGAIYFTAYDAANGLELWKNDGTTTTLVRNIYPDEGSTSPSNLINVGGTLYFVADNGVNGRELWKSDGTTAGTVMVRDISQGSGWSSPVNLTNVNGILYFTGNNGVNGAELWKSDGTAAGTILVKDIVAGGNSSSPGNLTNVNGVLYFTATDNTNGNELWKSDGTAVGTILVKDINPGAAYSSASNLTNVNGTLYFTAENGTSGPELWKSNGTAAGTVMVKDIFTGSTSSGPSNLINVNGILYFTASDSTNGYELWKSDGTTAGTVIVKDINPGNVNASVSNLTNVNGVLYFTAVDPTLGWGIWKSDGTEAGTVFVKEIGLPAGGSLGLNLVNADGTFYFVAFDPTFGTELWKSDGTTVGTVRVTDINAGLESSGISNLTYDNGILYFLADDGASGQEVWSFNVNVPLNNQAPVNILPATQTLAEDGTLILSAATGNAIAISDSDAGNNPLQVSLTTTNGTLTLSRTIGLSFTAGDGTADAAMIFTGTLANINAALNGLQFSPIANFNGTASVQIATNDQGSGTNNPFSDTDTLTITVNPVNDAPLLANAIANQSATAGTAFGFTVPLATFSDIDAGDSLSYSATLDNGNLLPSWLTFNPANRTFSGTPTNQNVGTLNIRVTAMDTAGATVNDVFAVAIAAGNSAPVLVSAIADQAAAEDSAFTFTIPANTFSDANGDTLTYSATLDNGNPLPSWLTFNPTTRTFSGTPLNPNVGNVNVRVTVMDPSGAAVSDVFALAITNTNDAPLLANAIADQSATAGTAFGFTVPLATFSDIDAGDSLSYSATLSNGNPLPTWLTFNPSTRTFSGSPLGSDLGILNIQVTATDIAGATVSDIFTVTVGNAANSIPTITLAATPATYTENGAAVIVNSSLLLSDSNHTTLQGATVTISNFVAGQDSLNFTNQNGITGIFNSVTGVLTLTGAATLTDYQTALRSVSYRNSSDNPSTTPRSLSFTVNDGTDSSLPAIAQINITPVNDAPVLTVPASQTVTSNTPVALAGISLIDLDAGLNPLRATIAVTNGVISLNSLSGLTFTTGDGTQDSALTFTGSLTALNAALNNLTYQSNAGYSGTDVITFNISDLGNTGGAALTDTKAINLIVSTLSAGIVGTNAAEVFSATANTDVIRARGGNDRILAAFSDVQQSDWFDGELGTDQFVLVGGLASTALTVDFTNPTQQLLGIPGLVIRNFERFDFAGFNGVLTVIGGTQADEVIGGAGNDILSGGNGNDILSGSGGNDTLDGGLGTNSLTGGLGNDTYLVSSSTDRIIEASNAGIDQVFASVTFTLANNVENLTLTGTNSIDGVGNGLDNHLIGNAATNVLSGGGGNDILDGGLGSDNLIGGTGNDTYIVDMLGDIVTEAANAGTDTVQASLNWTLGDNLENLILTGQEIINGTGNGLNNVITGNSANNVLIGFAGNDTLNGGLGADTLFGGLGNDILNLGADTSIDSVWYTLGDGNDIINQFTTGAGGDLIGFTNIPAIDVVTNGSTTWFRVSDGIVGNARFGSGTLIATLQGSEFTPGTMGFNIASGNTAQFLFA